jgi:single-strand DNA-binding protein
MGFSMINNVTLTGRMTKDAELRFTANGTPVASLTLAVNKRFKREDGPEADFINCVVWGKQA